MRIVTVIKIGLTSITLFICGCSPVQFDSWDKTVLSPTYWNRATGEQQAKATRQQIERSLVRGDVKQAQKFIFESRKENVPEDRLADLYTKVENRLLQDAKLSIDSGHPDRAGLLFRMARDIYPDSAQLQATIDLTPYEIDDNIEQCADTLMKNGLILYRAGELDKAIKVWRGIGQFHPSHAPSEVALATARQQLKNLELLTSKNGT